MPEENDVKLFMYQFNFENIEGHQDQIRFCAYSEEEAIRVFNEWCVSDMGLSKPYEASMEKIVDYEGEER